MNAAQQAVAKTRLLLAYDLAKRTMSAEALLLFFAAVAECTGKTVDHVIDEFNRP
jgi:hypothetical protein